MLVLSRVPGSSIMIGDEIEIRVLHVRRGALIEISGPAACPGQHWLHVNDLIGLSPQITVLVLRVNADKVRIGIEAPRWVEVHRREVWERLRGLAVV